jgi:ADP-ribose pyrophosphatase
MADVEVFSERVLFDDFFRIVEAQVGYRRLDGTLTAPARQLVFDRGDSAAGVVVDEERDVVLLARQFRYPTVAAGPGWPLELMAGMVAQGELPDECLRRELIEEFGFAAASLRPISSFYASPGGSSERIHLFYVTVRSDLRVGPGGGKASEGEEIELVEVARSDVPELLPRIVDAKTLVGLSWLLLGGGGRT